MDQWKDGAILLIRVVVTNMKKKNGANHKRMRMDVIRYKMCGVLDMICGERIWSGAYR